MSIGGNFVPTPLQFGQSYDPEKIRRLAEDVVRLAQRVSSVASSVTGIGGVPSTSGVTSGFVLTVLASGGYGWAVPTLAGTVPWSQITGIPTSFPPAQHVLATTAGLGIDHTVSGLTPGQVLLATGTSAAAFGKLNYAQLGDVSTAGLQVGFSPVWNGTQWVPQNVSQSFSGLTPGTVYTAVSSTVASFLPLTTASITGVFGPAQLGLGTPQYGIDPTTDNVLTGNGYWTPIQNIDISWSQISDVPKQLSNLGRFNSAFDGLVPKTGVSVSRGYVLRDDGTWAPPAVGTGGGTVTSITQGAGITCTPNPITGSGVVALTSISNNNVLGNISGGSAAPVGLTGAQVTSLLSVFNTTTQGVVPASGGVSNTFLREDGVFATVSATVPLTTKGDLLTWTTALARLPVGTDGQTLFADSTQPTGLRWGASSVSPLTTKGDIYTFSTVNARLGVGTNGQALVADSTQTTGLRWSAATALFSGLAQYGKDPETDTVLTGNGWWTEVRGLDISWAQISNVPPQVSNLFQSLVKYDFGAPGYTGTPLKFLRQDGMWTSPFPTAPQGSILYYGASGWTTLSPGTTGQVLTTHGAGANPSWSTAGGGLTLIGKATAGSAVASLTVSGIPGTYTALQIILYGQSDTTNTVEMCLTFNGDTGANYDYQNLQGWNSNAQASGTFNANFADVGTLTASNVSTPGIASTIIPAYSSTAALNKVGTGSSALFISSLSANFAQNRTIVWHPGSSAAITSVTVTAQTGNIAAGGFMAVYGIP